VRDLVELKISEGGQPVTRPAPTQEEVAKFEAHMGALLPQDYVQFLAFSNGGQPQIDSFVPQGGEANDMWDVAGFYHLSSDREDPDCLWNVYEVWRPYMGANRVPVACDGGGNQIVLNLGQDPASVEICIHDEDFRMFPVAASFSQFLDLLCVDPDMI
jgi:cell wall assembly regulator SMI1